MKIRGLLFVCMLLSPALFSQSGKHKEKHNRGSVNYYHKNTNLSRRFTAQYNKLVSGAEGYTKKDSLLANKLIKKLRQQEEIAFHRLMRVRLEWEFKEHLVLVSLDSVKLLLKNNIDSACYYYMLAIYFRDSMLEKRSRKLGFVQSIPGNKEIPDWKKINMLRWKYPVLIESNDGDNLNLGDGGFDKRMMDSSIYYYRKAIDQDKTEFYYMKELLFFLAKFGEELVLQETIKQCQRNYSRKEKQGFAAWLAESVARQEKVKELKMQ